MNEELQHLTKVFLQNMLNASKRGISPGDVLDAVALALASYMDDEDLAYDLTTEKLRWLSERCEEYRRDNLQ